MEMLLTGLLKTLCRKRMSIRWKKDFVSISTKLTYISMLSAAFFFSYCTPTNGVCGSVVVKALRCQTVPGSIPSGVTWDFFRGSFWRNHVPWGRLSLWKWVPGISPGVKAVGAFSWRPTTLVVRKVEEIRGLNLPRTPRAISACRGTPLLYFLLQQMLLFNNSRALHFTFPVFILLCSMHCS